MNAKKYLKTAAYELICEKPIEKLNTKAIFERAEVSRQTFYRLYRDKYAIANEIYDELFQTDIIDPKAVNSNQDWREMYFRQFSAYRKHLDFVRHLFSSRETGCTLDHEIDLVMAFDRDYIRKKGGNVDDPRIQFAIEAKDVGGTWAMRDWILGGMQVSDEEMAERFALVIPKILLPYYTDEI